MKHILIIGATGNIGKYLTIKLLKTKRYRISAVSRSNKKLKEVLDFPIEHIVHDFSKDKLKRLLKVDIVINCAKEGIFSKKLNSSRKREVIRESRKIAQNIVDSFDEDTHFIQFSGMSAYSESLVPVSENSPLSNDFFGELARQIETPFKDKKSTILRLPLVIGQEMPIIQNIGILFRYFLGFRINSKNNISWIHVEDIFENIENLISSQSRLKLINLCAGSQSLKSFLKVISRITNRPKLIPLPKTLLKFLYKDESSVILKNLESFSIHQDFLNFKYNHLDLALEDSFEYLKTPTLKKKKYHHSYNSYQFIPKEINEVFDFFKDANNLENITPDKLNFTITSQSTPEIQEGTNFTYSLKLNGVKFNWRTIIENWNPPYRFTDFQKNGPYEVWYHTHSFYEVEGGTLMHDNVKYRLPLSFLGELFGLFYVKKNVKEIFEYRYNYISELYKDE